MAVVDAPSDRQDGMNAIFRMSARACERHRGGRGISEEGQLTCPVWLVGTSMGTFSAAGGAIASARNIDGLVLTSTITRSKPDWKIARSHRDGVASMALARITVPTLIVSHRKDGCDITPAADAPKLKGAADQGAEGGGRAARRRLAAGVGALRGQVAARLLRYRGGRPSMRSPGSSRPIPVNADHASLDIVVVGWHSHNQMFDEIGADLAKAGHRIVRYADRADVCRQAPMPLADVDMLLCVGNCPVTRAQIASGVPAARHRLRGHRRDGFDMAAASERGVVVANAQTEENIIGMAEATVLMILAALYDLNDAQDRLRRSLPRPDPLRARQLRGKTLGFIGLGKIGRETARLLAPWGAAMQYSARRDADLAGLPPMQRVDLDTLLRTSDIVVVLASLNERDARAAERGKAAADEEDRGPGQHGARRHRRRAGAGRGAPGTDDRRRRARRASRSSRCRPTARCGRCRTSILTPHMIGHT